MDKKSNDEDVEEIEIAEKFALQKIKNVLEEKLCEYGSVEFMANIAMMEMYAQSSVFHNPANPLGENPFVVYSIGLFLSKNNLDAGEPRLEQPDEFVALLSEYFDNFRLSLMFSDGANFKPNDITAFIAQQEKIGDDVDPGIYPHQKNDYYQCVFYPLDNYFVSEYGFSIQDAINFVDVFLERLYRHMQYRYETIGEKYEEFKELAKHDSSLQKICEENKMTFEQACNIFANRMLCANSNSAFTISVSDYCKQRGIKNKNAFKKYLNTFSCTFGDQLENFEDPLSDNIIFYKPIIKLDNNTFFLPKPDVLRDKLDRLLEFLLEKEKRTQSETWDKFTKLKSKYLEDKSFEFLSRIFPEKHMFKNLYYWTGQQRMEIDLLVLYDNKILIVESKSGNLPLSAKREGHKLLKIRLEDLINKALSQAIQAKNYIKSHPKAHFWDKSKTKILLEIDSSKTNYEFFFINVTLEHLGSLATSLKNIEAFNFFKDNKYPWSVYLYDLDIVTDLLREPIYFIHYMEQRLIAQDQHIILSPSELILLGYYLKNGTFHTRSVTNSKNAYKINPLVDCMDSIEEYYIQNKGEPKLCIPKKLEELLLHIQKCHQKGFTKVTSLLLDFPLQKKITIAKKLESIFQQAIKNGTFQGFTLALEKPFDIGFSYFTFITMKEFYKYSIRQCRQLKQEWKITRWTVIGQNILDKKNYLTFFIYDDKKCYNLYTSFSRRECE